VIGELDEVPHRFEMSASVGVETEDGSADIGWGRVDLGTIEDVLPDDLVDQATDLRVQGLNPGSFARLVTDAESVEEVGTKEIQGETMTGLAAPSPPATSRVPRAAARLRCRPR
jgi:hypothetical protein